MDGLSSASPPPIFWNSRKRSANGKLIQEMLKEESSEAKADQIPEPMKTDENNAKQEEDEKQNNTESDPMAALIEKRKQRFEPLEPTNRCRISNEELLPPPDFDETSYPKGWLVGKKRKLVNVDVVESMRRIAVQEMNRKDREIDGLNQQLREDSHFLEHLQVQLVEEKRKRAEAERENDMLQEQISVLMNMLDENQGAMGEEGEYEEFDGADAPPLNPSV